MPEVDSGAVPDSFEVRGHIFTGLQALPPQEASRLHAGLQRYGNACGCGSGMIGAALACLVFVLDIPLLLAIAAVATGGVVGKCAGLWWARHRFNSLARELRTGLSATARDVTTLVTRRQGMRAGH